MMRRAFFASFAATCTLLSACGSNSTGDSPGPSGLVVQGGAAGASSGKGGSGGASGGSTGGVRGESGSAGSSGTSSAGAGGAAGSIAGGKGGGSAGATAGGASGSGGGGGKSGTSGSAGQSGGIGGGGGKSGTSGSAGQSGGIGGGGSASGSGGATFGGSSGAAGSGACADGATEPCGICGSGVSTCMNGTFGECVVPPSPPTIDLTGTIRDFHMSTVPGGHPDFESKIGDDKGIVAMMLAADGTPTYAPGPNGTSPTTHGQMYFDEWYHDTPGVNESEPYTITLTLVPGSMPPVYSYQNDSFFPIDNMLLGNDGEPHNYSFTYQIHTAFQYRGGETFTFSGDDDLFVFMNNVLVINLGGVHAAETQTVNLDDVAPTAGLQKCQVYPIDMFSAERHTVASDLGISTTLALGKQ